MNRRSFFTRFASLFAVFGIAKSPHVETWSKTISSDPLVYPDFNRDVIDAFIPLPHIIRPDDYQQQGTWTLHYEPDTETVEIWVDGKPIKVSPYSYQSHVDCSPELLKAFGPQ